MEELICASDKKKKEETVILYEVFSGYMPGSMGESAVSVSASGQKRF